MSNTQEQSLDVNTVFLPVSESCPEFLHCEKERQAVERLLSAGPEAFYSSIGTQLHCFLSSEEVNQISTWAKDFHAEPLQGQIEANGEDSDSERDGFCSTYVPAFSDLPAPDLELGWPERAPWGPKGSVTVHTSPPAEGEPPIREIIRRHLQMARQVIAIVTDRLTDDVIINDLHNAASRGVPVYIILNQRSTQENFVLNRLRHPNMQVRVLGGKTFCSREGRMVVGDMKDNFLLVDLETVIHGSYSLTWTDAHLHRQLITVLQGPVVDSFDQEFRILFAASFPIFDTWRANVSLAKTAYQPKDFSHLGFTKHLPLEPEILSPQSPPPDSTLDWVAMGLFQRESDGQSSMENPFNHHEEIVAQEMPLENNMLPKKNTPILESSSNIRNRLFDWKRFRENMASVTNNLPERSKSFNVPERSKSFNNPCPSPTDIPTPEREKSKEYILEKAISRQLSMERSTNSNDETTTRPDDEATEPADNKLLLSPSDRTERTVTESILEEESSSKEPSSKVENSPSSRKPLILRVPQSESFNSLSDIMKRLKSRQDTSERSSELSMSMMDLNVPNTDTNHSEKRVTLPRLKTSGFEEDNTPTSSLMKMRSDGLRPLLYRLPTKTFLPRERARTSTLLDWRRSLAEMDGQQE